MTLEEAALEHQYDVCIYFADINEEEPPGWYWDINGGYSSVGGAHCHQNINDCLEELKAFLVHFKPFEK